MTREERIMAYADGELDAAARTAFEIEMAHDPGLAGAVEAQRNLRRRVAKAYAGVLSEPAPERLIAACAGSAEVRPFPSRGPRSWGLPAWAAMAACLAVGVFAGRVLPAAGPLQAGADGALVARGQLAHALDGQLSGEAGPVNVGLSFRGQDGRYCRTFRSEADRLAGLACRDERGWSVPLAARTQPARRAEYRMAASDTPPAVLAAVDAMIDGQPLDRAGEAAARAKGWRN